MKGKRITKRFLCFCILFFCVFCFAGLHRNVHASATTEYTKLKSDIITAYQNYQTSVDVKSYKLYNNETTSRKISSIFEEIMNETPYLFYTGREFTKEVVATTNQITSFGLEYLSPYKSGGKVNIEKIKQTRQQLDKVVVKAKNQIQSSMNEVEKAMILHDYLVRNIAYYDGKATTECLSEVGALLKHKANCQGYSIAYVLLLNEVGIQAKCVTSDTMNHMWNLIRIKDNWYHVDLVWDDPISSRNHKDRYGMVLHENFLLSDSAVKRNGHTGFEATTANQSRYDRKYWRKCNTAFWFQSGKFVYGTSKGIYTRKSLGSKPRLLKKMDVECLVQYADNLFYFIGDRKTIYAYDIGKKRGKSIVKVSAGQNIVQLKCTSKQLTYRIVKAEKLYTKKKNVRKSVF